MSSNQDCLRIRCVRRVSREIQIKYRRWRYRDTEDVSRSVAPTAGPWSMSCQCSLALKKSPISTRSVSNWISRKTLRMHHMCLQGRGGSMVFADETRKVLNTRFLWLCIVISEKSNRFETCHYQNWEQLKASLWCIDRHPLSPIVENH